MAVVGYEWIVIGVIVVAFLIWGPSKIPEIARGLGRARKEFEDASKGFSSQSTTSSVKVADASTDPLIATAKRIGISTEGKTREEISDEIVRATGHS